MTLNPDHTDSSQGGTTDTAKQEAQHVKDEAQHAAKDMANTAGQEAGQVKDEVVGQAKGLIDSVRHEASSQASGQQQRLAEQSRTVADDLRRITQGERPESDLVNSAISTVADRAERFTTQLENKEPADLLQDVRRFASRRPGTFLAIAAGVGLLAGRLSRGLADSSDDADQAADEPQPGSRSTPPPPKPTTPPPVRPATADPGTRVPGSVYPEDTASTGVLGNPDYEPGARP